MSAPTVKRAKITYHSTDLACQVRRAVGWAAMCACGEHFPIRRDPDDARRDAIEHLETCLDSKRAEDIASAP